MSERILTTVALFVFILPLAGCIDPGNGSTDDEGKNGGEGQEEKSDDPADGEDATLRGVYTGTLTSDSGTDDLTFLTLDERAVALRPSDGTIFEGPYEVDGKQLTGTFHLYDGSGAKAGDIEFEGEVTEDGTLDGTFGPLPGHDEPTTFALTHHPESNHELSLYHIAETYRATDTDAPYIEVTIDVAGGLTGGDSLGCGFTDGTVAIPEPELNLMDIGLTTTPDCQGFPEYEGGRYEGFATVLENDLLFIATSGETGLAYRLPAQADPAPSEIPAWLQDLPERAWAKVNTNTKQDAIDALDEITDGCGRTASDGHIRRVWEAFAGSAWDPTRKVAWIFGGGHAVTTFNAPIAIDVFDREWQILHTQTQSIDSDFGDEYDSSLYVTGDFENGYDGAPPSAHAYDNNKYLPVLDKFITFGGAQAGDGSWWRTFLDEDGTQADGWPWEVGRTGPFLYDYERRDPTRVGGNSGTAVEPSGCDTDAVEGAEAWHNLDFMEALPSGWSSPDRSTVCRVEDGKDVCYHSRTSLQRIELDGQSATLKEAGSFAQGPISEHSAVIAPVDDKEIFLQVRLRPDSNFWKLKWWEIQDFPTTYDSVAVGHWAPYTVNFTNSSWGTSDPLPDEGHTPGAIYDSERDKIILWRGGRNLYELDPPDPLGEQGWAVLDFDDGPNSAKRPDASGGSGNRSVIGHFHYDAEWDLYFGVEGIHGDLWVYKPAGWNPG